MDLKDAYFYIRIAPHTQTVFLNSCQLSGRSTAFQYSVPPSGLLRPHALSKCINVALPTQIERKAHPQLSGRSADFSSVPGYAYQPHRLSVYSLRVPKLWEPASREIAWGMRPCLSWDRVGWEPASREIAWKWIQPLARSSRGQLSSLRLSGRAALFSWGYYRDCSYSRWWIQRYYIRYYTCARCSYGWNLESRERRGLREVSASRPHRSSDATQMRQMITMDASAHGWGLVCEGMPASGL